MRHVGKHVLIPVRGCLRLLPFATPKERANARLAVAFDVIVESFGNRTYRPRFGRLCSRFKDEFGALYEVNLSVRGILSVKKSGRLLARSSPFDVCQQRPKLDATFEPPTWI